MKFLIQWLAIALMAAMPLQAAESIPQPLQPWVPWVSKDSPHLKCPFINLGEYGNTQFHPCVWPGTLYLDVDDKGGQFRQRWQVLSKQWIELPGGTRHWPQSVKANGAAVAVLSHNGRPALHLPAGDYQISGHFRWSELPQNLDLFDGVAVVSMTLKGEPVAFPKVEHQRLWFKSAEPQVAAEDRLDMRVHRKLSDGVHFGLETRLTLTVSGKNREARLGKVLPPHFKLKAISGDLAAFLDAEGVLVVKLKPGFTNLTVTAVASREMAQITRPAVQDAWPVQEIWSFQPDETVRSGTFSGGQVIDTRAANVPLDWQSLASYLVEPGDTLSYQLQQRGKPTATADRLALHREMWLDFAGQSFTFVDNINGEMAKDWRLSMKAPFTLKAGQQDGQPVLVTSLGDGERGIENRNKQLYLAATGSAPKATQLPVSGWQQEFTEMSLRLNLPPGHRLMAVSGADEVSVSWWDDWALWHWLVILLSALIAVKLFGLLAGLVTAMVMVLIFHEAHAPLALLVNGLIALGVHRHQPFTWLKSVSRLYLLLSLLALVGSSLYFAANQIQVIMNPQLEERVREEPPQNILGMFNQFEDGIYRQSNQAFKGATLAQEEESLEVKRKGFSEVQSSVIKRRRDSRGQMFEPQALNTYQPGGLIQAGPGLPAWEWHEYELYWHNRVTSDDQLKLWIMPPWLTGLFRIAGLVLLGWWLWIVGRHTPTLNIERNSAGSASAVAMLLMLGAFSGWTPEVKADDFPDQSMLKALQTHVEQPPECAPACVSVSHMKLWAEPERLTVALTIDAGVDAAVAIPSSPFWRPKEITLNDKPHQLLLRKSGRLMLPVNAGVNQVRISGPVMAVGQLQLLVPQVPRFIEVEAGSEWAVSGVRKNALIGKNITLTSVGKANQARDGQSRWQTTPYVEVTRQIKFQDRWLVTTSVNRVAPLNGPLAVKVAILPGEKIASWDYEVVNGQLEVNLPAGQGQVQWVSTLERASSLTLTAMNSPDVVEKWQVSSSTLRHLTFSGLVEAREPIKMREHNWFFLPRRGEMLEIGLTTPQAVSGSVLAFDSVSSDLTVGLRETTHTLTLEYRSTRATEHTIEMPEGYKLHEVHMDDRLLTAQPKGRELTLPVQPGTHKWRIETRKSGDFGIRLQMPVYQLNADAANIRSAMRTTEPQWVVWTYGPAFGPAVGYWFELLLFALLAVILAKLPLTPLNLSHWLLLGFGLGFNNWPGLACFAVALALVSILSRKGAVWSIWPRRAAYLGVYGFCVIAFFMVVAGLPQLLLEMPYMGIEGNGSHNTSLRWFSDQSTGLMFQAGAVVLPSWTFKAVILLWLTWFGYAFSGWAKWVWQTMGVLPRLQPKD